MYKNGFTLLEVLIAVTILVFVITGTGMMIIQALNMSLKANDMLEATVFVSGVSAMVQSMDSSYLNDNSFPKLDYKGNPVGVVFFKSLSGHNLTRVDITLIMLDGSQRTFTTYVAEK